jgi:hypothetical protein
MTTYLPQKKIKTEVEIKEDKQTSKQVEIDRGKRDRKTKRDSP